ncbi:MAG: hypothetical protein QW607_10955 [Desulfurococcaceae archaeon]
MYVASCQGLGPRRCVGVGTHPRIHQELYNRPDLADEDPDPKAGDPGFKSRLPHQTTSSQYIQIASKSILYAMVIDYIAVSIVCNLLVSMS